MTAELIVALDVPDRATLCRVVDALPAEITFYKVGLELFGAEGPPVLDELRRRDKRIFLDLKLHDIPRTVAHAVRAVTAHGVDLLTVHAAGGRAMLGAAAEAAAGSGLRLLAVTLLTSLDESDLREQGIARPASEQVEAMAQMALAAGVDGLVCSPREVGALRERFGPEPMLVVPGIRPAGGAVGDQKRVAAPGEAVRAGASHLVVGRPILGADDPAAAANAILDDIEKTSQ